MAWFSRPLLQPLRPQLQSARQMVENVEHRMDRDPPRPGLVFSGSSPAGTSSLQPSQPTARRNSRKSAPTIPTYGKAKQPQVGTDYSNDYVAELMKQGLKDKELLDRLNARDFEFPDETSSITSSIPWISTPARSTGGANSIQATLQGAVTARTASARKPLSPTASVFTSTLITLDFSAMISTATKSGTPRSKAFRPSSISVRPLHPLLSMASLSSSTTTRNSSSSRHSRQIPASKSDAQIALFTLKAPIARPAGRVPTSGRTPSAAKLSPLALASPLVTTSKAKNCGVSAGCPPCQSRVLSPTAACCISTVGLLKPWPRSNQGRTATSPRQTAPS